jgi:aspartate aminotransferase
MNSPSNPSGMIYSESELKSIADVLLKYPDVLILSDDIYEHIKWSAEPFKNIINVCPELKNRTIVINGVSKSYAMTGWRIGYAAGNAKIIGAMKKIQSQCTSNPCSIAQYASEAALKSGTACIEPMVKEFKKRHDFLYISLKEIEGIKIIPADGTFYAFPNIENLIKRLPGLKNDADFSEMLLNEAEIAVVPGTEFGCPGTIRLSYALSMETLKEAVSRIKKICCRVG